MTSKAIYHKYMGADAAGGYANFFEPGLSTPKITYTDEDYDTADATNVEIGSTGWIKTYLIGDYDVDVFNANGDQLSAQSANSINPQESTSADDLNLILNGGFETDTDSDGTPDNWVLVEFTGSTNGVTSSDQRHGTKSMEFVSTGSGGGHITSENFITINEDATYEFAFSILSSVVDVRNKVDVIWYQDDFTLISTTNVYDDSTTNPTTWTRKEYELQPPANARHAKVRITGCDSTDATPGTVRFDDVRLVPEIKSVLSIANFVGGEDIYVVETANTYSPFDVDANVAQSLWESIGPTGAGADNTWSALDDIPDGASAVILQVYSRVISNATGSVGFSVYTKKNGTPATLSNGQLIAGAFTTDVGGSTEDDTRVYDSVFVPLDADNTFDLQWFDAASSSRTIDLYLKGFVK